VPAPTCPPGDAWCTTSGGALSRSCRSTARPSRHCSSSCAIVAKGAAQGSLASRLLYRKAGRRQPAYLCGPALAAAPLVIDGAKTSGSAPRCASASMHILRVEQLAVRGPIQYAHYCTIAQIQLYYGITLYRTRTRIVASNTVLLGQLSP
jgi:hypothetical protein